MIATPEMREWRKNGESYMKIAAKLGVSRSTVTRALTQDAESNKSGNVGKPAPARSVIDFRKLYDKDIIVPQKIRAAFKIMPDWLYETEFVREAGLTLADLAAYRDMFVDHIVTLKRDSRRVWARTPAIAEQLKEYL